MADFRGVSDEKNCYICGKLKSEKGEGWCSYPHARIPVRPVDPEHPGGFWIWEQKRDDVENGSFAQGPSNADASLQNKIRRK